MSGIPVLSSDLNRVIGSLANEPGDASSDPYFATQDPNDTLTQDHFNLRGDQLLHGASVGYFDPLTNFFQSASILTQIVLCVSFLFTLTIGVAISVYLSIYAESSVYNRTLNTLSHNFVSAAQGCRENLAGALIEEQTALEADEQNQTLISSAFAWKAHVKTKMDAISEENPARDQLIEAIKSQAITDLLACVPRNQPLVVGAVRASAQHVWDAELPIG